MLNFFPIYMLLWFVHSCSLVAAALLTWGPTALMHSCTRVLVSVQFLTCECLPNDRSTENWKMSWRWLLLSWSITSRRALWTWSRRSSSTGLYRHRVAALSSFNTFVVHLLVQIKNCSLQHTGRKHWSYHNKWCAYLSFLSQQCSVDQNAQR